MRRAIALAFGASFAALAGCGAIVGLSDHQLAPDDAGAPLGPGDGAIGAADGGDAASDTASDAANAPCPPGYPLIGARCGDAVVEVGASATHACAVLLNGELWCWGKNQLGALGVDPATTTSTCGGFACRPAPARVPGVESAKHVALAADVTCVLDDKGVVSCFGRNARGELGHDPKSDPQCATQLTDGGATKEPCSFTPQTVTTPGNVVLTQIGGGDAMCALSSGGHVYCWGDDYLAEDGVFPIPPNGDVVMPTRIASIAGDATKIAVSATYTHGCAERVLGSIWCWGSNIKGELGHDPGPDAGDDACIFGAPCSKDATQVPAIGASIFAAGQLTSCAVKGDGTVWCWGGNETGLLGNGESVDSAPHAAPQPVVGVSNVVAIELRFSTAYAIDGAANVWVWGNATDNALGVDTPRIACQPGLCVAQAVQAPALAGSVQIASTNAGGVALKSDGSVWVWGTNVLGTLGHAPSAGGDHGCTDGPCGDAPQPLVGLP